ncbi:MAG: hypothetical protein OHK93_007083 [Ramalina farinacea]|uniref:CNH domain-containing protein n=1 Tax=Ramalina farinacea TaxID=258253 RepID=A0AA43QJT8_9LECA|nr:hypothetical protein [Ramalina farinacea]
MESVEIEADDEDCLRREVQDRALTSSFLLKPLVQDIPLSPDGTEGETYITCVELCDDNLYIGTSRAEILHFVSLPSAANDAPHAPSYIFASRLQPAYNAQTAPQPLPGIQQLLLLPKVSKACILCNGTLSFYSLPELSPAFGPTTVANCTWVGGIDLNGSDGSEEHGLVVMICVKNKIRLVRIADEVRRVRDIQFHACLTCARRGDYACVADARGYSLLDVENQQKISLFPISSLDENPTSGQVEDLSSANETPPARTSSLMRPVQEDGKGHSRSTSLGGIVSGIGRRQASPRPESPRPSVAATSPTRTPSHTKTESNPENVAVAATSDNTPLPPPPRSDSLRPPTKRVEQSWQPLISSPTPTEFLLVTGSGRQEAGVGIFVNLDGDVVRGTLEFSRYPSSVVVDGPEPERGIEPGFVLAAMAKLINGEEKVGIEVQRWDVEDNSRKEWLSVPDESTKLPRTSANRSPGSGLRTIETPIAVSNSEIGALLRNERYRLSTMTGTSPDEDDEADVKRQNEERAFGQRLGNQKAKHVYWLGSTIFYLTRNPLALKINAHLDQACNLTGKVPVRKANRASLLRVIDIVRGQEPLTETDFLALEFLRQKTSLILAADLLAFPDLFTRVSTSDLASTGSLLVEGGLDPRVLIGLVPALCDEVLEGVKGIWIHAGLTAAVEVYAKYIREMAAPLADGRGLQFVKHYLYAWRERKGFGSVAAETEVFKTIDAALLQVLLMQDTKSRSAHSKPSPERAELYAFVDSGIDCFERAVEILEAHHRLFTLSKLYQSRRIARKVLETWRRIIETEDDQDRGLLDGEHKVLTYLTKVKDTALVDEYGTWLARRNPYLGVQVFTNDASKVKWEPHQVIMLLRRRAPNAVKEYLEHLVFVKKNIGLANDLISYYLDSVLSVLSTSEEARERLAQSYEFYRALRPPKPTYREYITENALAEPWWHDRLRLLELIGGSHGSDFSYDVGEVLSRIEPFEQDLVPESIILDGRQGRHKQALRLLTHGLGDHHTAVNYCLLGGASIFHPAQGSGDALSAPSREEQSLLFGYLLAEFLGIEDAEDRLERTSELLARFGAWYDVRQVLEQIPETWSVEDLSDFLVSALRRLLQEKNEATMTKALSGAENLQTAHAFVEKMSVLGPQIESVDPT